MLCRMLFGITTLTRVGILLRSSFVTIITIIVTIFVRILKRDTKWLPDFRYKIVIPWLLWGISEQNALTLALHPRDTGVIF